LKGENIHTVVKDGLEEGEDMVLDQSAQEIFDESLFKIPTRFNFKGFKRPGPPRHDIDVILCVTTKGCQEGRNAFFSKKKKGDLTLGASRVLQFFEQFRTSSPFFAPYSQRKRWMKGIKDILMKRFRNDRT